MPGKDPHRPEGKTRDAEHQQIRPTGDSGPQADPRTMPDPAREPASYEVGGSRPSVPSRVKEAIVRSQGTEEEEE